VSDSGCFGVWFGFGQEKNIDTSMQYNIKRILQRVSSLRASLCTPGYTHSLGINYFPLIHEHTTKYSHPKVAWFKIYEVKARTDNLVLTLHIMRVWLGYAFYSIRGSSWMFWIWFYKEGKEVLGETPLWCQIMSSLLPRGSRWACRSNNHGQKWLIWVIWEDQLI
jgi:hypothetical protein